MKLVKLNAGVREAAGSGVSKRLRRGGAIPAVIYGESGTQLLQLDAHQFKMAYRDFANRAVLLELAIPGHAEGTFAVIQELQRNPRTDGFVHVDFKEVVRGREMEVSVPVRAVGRADGVRNFGGVLEVNLHTVRIRCRPRDLPEDISVDVTSLGIGKSIHLGDVTLPEGVTLLDDPDLVVVTCVGSSGGASDAAAAETTAAS